MLLAIQEPENYLAEVYFLPTLHIAKSEKILQEIQLLNLQNLGLDVLSIFHQEIDWLIKNFPAQRHGQNLLPELKSYRLALACRIEFLQTLTP